MVLSVKTTAFTSIFTLPPLNPDRERKLRLMSQLYDQGITTRQISDRHLAKVLQRGAASWLTWEAYTYRVCRAGRMTYHQYAHLRSGLVLGVRSRVGFWAGHSLSANSFLFPPCIIIENCAFNTERDLVKTRFRCTQRGGDCEEIVFSSTFWDYRVQFCCVPWPWQQHYWRKNPVFRWVW